MDDELEEAVPAAFDGDRLDRFVAAISGRSRAAVKQLIVDGQVTVDGRVTRTPAGRIETGAIVSVRLPTEVAETPAPDPGVPFEVVHEDADIVIVDKPAGVVVHPGAGQPDQTLVNGLLHRYPELESVGETHRPGIVHRLDRGTSGLLVVARSPQAHAALVGQLAAHEPERVYLALAWGQPDRDLGTIDAPIGRSTRHPTRMTVTPDGRNAITHYAVRGRFEVPVATALLECRLETGRTHQIRVHLRAIGHPVVGDRDYDGGRPGLDPGRPFLHASGLRLRHPVSGEPIEAHSPLPEDLETLLAGCR